MSRRPGADEHAAVARRRLALLSAEIAARSTGVAVETPTDQSPSPSPSLERRPAPGRHARRRLGARESAAAWVHDRLPPAAQGRVELGAMQLAVVVLVVGVAALATTWWVLRSRDQGALVEARPVPASAVEVPSTGAAPAGAGPAPAAAAAPAAATPGSPGTTGSVVVDVEGKVRRPGIVTLPVGARVVDALAAAGGARTGVSLRSLNLARVLADGEQILVGVPAVQGVAAAAVTGRAEPGGPGVPAGLVNVNTADQAGLETLPGVGPVTAQAIIRWRTEFGGFSAVDELLEVSGIGAATLAQLAPFVTL